ncbi:MAG TPA: porin, partial [Isosphaeraceae bacterium]
SKAAQDQVPLKAFADQSYKQRYGFAFQSENKEFELRVNGLVQFDTRIYEQANQIPVVGDFNIPRARLYFSGRVTKLFEYQLSFQRSTNNFDILNAYINVHADDRFQLRAGRFRVPYTYEWAKLSNWELLTPDRSPFALNFGPNRMVGLMGYGSLFQKRLEYQVGVFNGPRNSYQDFNYSKDVAAFLDFRPFLLREESPLKNFSVGGSVLAGRENNPPVPALLRGSTPASGNTLTSGSGDVLIAVPFLAFNTNVRERGDRALWELHTTYFFRGLSLLGAWESGHNDFALRRVGAPAVDLPVAGYFVQAGYLLTGEQHEKLDQVEPLHPFNLSREKFGLGALEVQGRYSEVNVDRKVFTAGLADPALWTNHAQFIDLGFNWYLNKYVRFVFDWQRGIFADPVFYRPGPSLQKTSDLFWMRLQLYF